MIASISTFVSSRYDPESPEHMSRTRLMQAKRTQLRNPELP